MLNIIKRGKTAGRGKITAEMLKNLQDKGIELLRYKIKHGSLLKCMKIKNNGL